MFVYWMLVPGPEVLPKNLEPPLGSLIILIMFFLYVTAEKTVPGAGGLDDFFTGPLYSLRWFPGDTKISRKRQKIKALR